MKYTITAFVLMVWLGMGISFNAVLDASEKRLNCEHSWWAAPLVVVMAPAIFGAGLTDNIFGFDLPSAETERKCL